MTDFYPAKRNTIYVNSDQIDLTERPLMIQNITGFSRSFHKKIAGAEHQVIKKIKV